MNAAAATASANVSLSDSSPDRAVATSITPWLNGRSWDLAFLILSVVIVPFVLLLVHLRVPADFINLGVAGVIGGPHLFSTYTATYLDRGFRKRNMALLVAATLIVPTFVFYMAITNFQVLLSFFIFVASLHLLQQNAYITDIYRRRAGTVEPRWSRWIDIALLMVGFYPVATYKIVHDDFFLGDVKIIVPQVFMQPLTYWAISIFFGTALVLWVAKSLVEWRKGTLNKPKTLLIGVTTVTAFLIPAAAGGERLELAFQAANAWHSFQYLALVWLINRMRLEHGHMQSSITSRVSGVGSAFRFYGLVLATTLALFGVILLLKWTNPLGLSPDQYYYGMILSPLLIHYVLDAFLFAFGARRGSSIEAVPYAAPATLSVSP